MAYYEIDLNSAESCRRLGMIKDGDTVRVGRNGQFGDRMVVRTNRNTGALFLGSGVKFDRIRRVTGDLTGSLSRFNDAKRAEVGDRKVHMHLSRPRLPAKAAKAARRSEMPHEAA